MSAEAVAAAAVAEVSVKVGRRRGLNAQAVCADLEMWAHARCRGTSTESYAAWYPPFGENYRGDKSHEYPPRSRAMCAACPIRIACAGYAAAAQEAGYWGGTSEHDRGIEGKRLDILAAAGLRSAS